MALDIEIIPQRSHLLGRHKVHDDRSRAFDLAEISGPIDKSTWRTKSLRVIDPIPNPDQLIGCCTGVAKCVQLNTVGNRKLFRVLKMRDAVRIYSRNTQLDPFEGEYPPDDTGSSGLASCKTAIEFGLGGEYRWIFGGADEVVQNIMEGRPISVGTNWYEGMFNRNDYGLIRPTGEIAGGHQYVIRGYNRSNDTVIGRCWWGEFRDFQLARTDLQRLLVAEGGDAHFQKTT